MKAALVEKRVLRLRCEVDAGLVGAIDEQRSGREGRTGGFTHLRPLGGTTGSSRPDPPPPGGLIPVPGFAVKALFGDLGKEALLWGQRVIPQKAQDAGFDPAIASGPMLTTVTDMCGFFLVLSLASLVLPAIS